MAGSHCRVTLVYAPRRSVVKLCCRSLSAACSSPSAASLKARMAGSSSCPAGERCTPLLLRTSRFSPSSFSSEFIICVSPDCV